MVAGCAGSKAEEAGLISWYREGEDGMVFNETDCPKYPGVDFSLLLDKQEIIVSVTCAHFVQDKNTVL